MELVQIRDIVCCPKLFVRNLKGDVVKKYTELLSSDWGEADHWPFPPLTLYRVDGELLLVDGRHRLEAAREIRSVAVKDRSKKAVPCEIRIGTIEDAMLAAAAANGKHGEPLTAEERSTAVSMALTADATLSDRSIARMVGCSPTTVARIRDLLEEVGVVEAPVFRVGGDGKKRQTKTVAEKKAELIKEIEAVGKGIEQQLSIMDSCWEEQRQESADARAARPSPSEIERKRFLDIFLRSYNRRELLSSLIPKLEPADLAFFASLIEDRMAALSQSTPR
jgi:ParB-like chromosome segregation protein Spo0J